MADFPTSPHFGLGLDVANLVVNAMANGVTHDQVIDTLEHLTSLARLSKAMGLNLGALHERVPASTFSRRSFATDVRG